MDSPPPNENIVLIGRTRPQITSDKLPNNLQILQVLFYNTRHLRMTIKNAIKLVIKEVEVFWSKAQLETQKEQRCCEKLNKLYLDYRAVQKFKGKNVKEDKEKNFSDRLKLLFDISHCNVLKTLGAEQKNILLQQSLYYIANGNSNG